MNSFFFWLTIAASAGALLSQLLHLGVIEIVIIAVVANFGFYGYRRLARDRKRTAMN
ncbi:hypothetical protein CA51_10940 [Rosistilla oblonga]|uniref:hypothetical protein n=1 Tax=Rosistilla oblonga TaxID=2527990 RepID=UPI00118B7C86|nr:hypothetical protein [Rosistilla oblonga]QDV11233.1 hypothetical protein CA51_10940 [Rosistilla oblonga]